MTSERRTPWYRRLLALAELGGDVTQEEIAERIGVSPGAVSSWKRGTLPKWEQVVDAAKAYGVEPLELMRIAYLAGEEGNNNPARKKPNPSREPL
jgi:transcriptional regulator with XRE-family HTH domain